MTKANHSGGGTGSRPLHDWPGIHLDALATDGTPPVAKLTVYLTANAEITGFQFERTDGADQTGAALAAFNVARRSLSGIG